MSMNIRYPNISAVTPTEQLNQVKSYLHQLVEQLNYALPTLGGAGSTIEVQGSDLSYYELRTLIIQELQEAETKIERLTAKLEALTGKTVELHSRIDPSCLGGVRLDFDGRQIDGTVRRRLEDIRSILKNTVL